MARLDISMTPAELRDFLLTQRTLSISSIGKDGYPHPVPMWFTFDGNAIYFSTYTVSQKVKNVLRDSRVSCLVEDGERYEELRAVVIKGRCEIVKDQQEAARAIDGIQRRYSAARTEEQARRSYEAYLTGKRVILKITPEKTISWDHRKIPAAKPRAS